MDNNEIEINLENDNIDLDIDTTVERVVEKNYNNLINKPQIAGITLYGNKSLEDLGIQPNEEGKGLSTNDYTTEEKEKLSNIEAEAEVNKIDTIKVNGTAQTITNKEVDIPVPTALSELTEDSTHRTVTDEDKANWDAKAEVEDIPTDTSDLTNDSGFIDNTVNNLTNYTKTGDMNTAINNAVSSETTARENADLNLQSQIDAITSASDVVDIVGTYTELQNYDTSSLTADDVIKVLQDSQHNNALSYYRWVVTSNVGAWTYIGSEGPFYTKSEADTLLNAKQNEINANNKLNADLVDDTNTTNKFTNATEKAQWNAKYDKPAGGIPKTDLANDVQTSLGKAETAIQQHQDISGKEDKTNKVTEIDTATPSADEYPSESAVVTYVSGLVGNIESILEELDVRRWCSMSIANRITAMEEHISNAYTGLEWLGADLTNVDKNINNISSVLEDIWDEQPKVTATDVTEATLENTKKARMGIDLKGNASQNTAILPSEYTQVDYIELSGSQYVDTNYYLSSNNLLVKTKIYTSIPTEEQDIVSNQDNSTGRFVLGFYNNAVFAYSRDNTGTDTNATSNTFSEANTFIIEADYNYNDKIKTLKVNGTTYSETQNKQISNSNRTIKLFSSGTTQSSYVTSGKIYYMKIFDNNVLVRDFVPCYRNNDNEVGLYDLVNKVFYKKTNVSQSSMTYGATSAIPNPDYPQEIHTVSGDNEVKIQNKNFANFTLLQQVPAIGTGEMTPYNNGASTDFIQIDNTKEYSYSYEYVDDSRTTTRYIMFYDKSKNYLGYVMSMSNGYKLNSSNYFSSTKYVKLRVDNLGRMKWTQLEQNPIVTEYIEHKETIYPINLGNIEMCKIGNYEDEFVKVDGVWKKKALIKKNIYVGAENEGWTFENSSASPTNRTVIRKTEMEYASTDYFSNRFVKGSTTSNRLVVRLNSNNSTTYISLDDTLTGIESSDTTNVKYSKMLSYFQANNVVAYYILATPVYIDLPQSLQNQLEAIYQAMSYDEQTNVSQTNNDLPFIMDLSALRLE